MTNARGQAPLIAGSTVTWVEFQRKDGNLLISVGRLAQAWSHPPARRDVSENPARNEHPSNEYESRPQARRGPEIPTSRRFSGRTNSSPQPQSFQCLRGRSGIAANIPR